MPRLALLISANCDWLYGQGSKRAASRFERHLAERGKSPRDAYLEIKKRWWAILLSPSRD